MFYSVNNGSLKITDKVIPPCCGTLSSILLNYIEFIGSIWIHSFSKFLRCFGRTIGFFFVQPSVPSVPLGSALDVSDATGELRNASVD